MAALGVYGFGGDSSTYMVYGGAVLGFLGVLFGIMGILGVSENTSGRGQALSGVLLGFVSLAVSAYEYLYPGDLWKTLEDYIPL